ncbi:MAG: O-methyltransferase [Salinirussus sp.]
MSELLQTGTDRFLDAVAPEGDDVVAAMEAYGEAHGPTTVGRTVGGFLRLLTRLAGADRVFEFGSGYGYSAYWFALGGAEVVLTDVDGERLDAAREFFERGGLRDRATFERGDAHEVFAATDGPFDAVLLDHDKARYAEAFDEVREKLAAGGLVVVDNAMVSTSIQFPELVATLEGEDPSLNGATRGVAEVLRAASEAAAFELAVLPIGEGVAVARHVE